METFYPKPTDIVSRGSTIKRLRSDSLWWNGPTWLTDEDSWPKDIDSSKPEEYDAEYCNGMNTSTVCYE
ncbi:hypothetical protein T08_11215 [Trichinella sp. T8]|nr:hypothetical protein T08_11215 [Trichinella sp. T8]